MNLFKENYKAILISFFIFLLLIVWASWKSVKAPNVLINNFEDCIKYHSVISTHPAKCWTPEGLLYVEYSFNDPRATIDFENDSFGLVEDNHLLIEGEIMGSWFFEASFLAELWNGQGQRFAWSLASTSEDWMTNELIPFQIIFEIPEDHKLSDAILVLIKDNPSGLKEHDDALAWPIKLKYPVDLE